MENAIIHVVDDDDSMRTSLTRLLSASGYETRSYRSAGEFLMSERPAAGGCVVLDLKMPGPSGLDLQEALAKDARPLPVIFLTGNGDIPTSVQAMKAGAVDFLTKPVQRERLMAAIADALSVDAKRRVDKTTQSVLSALNVPSRADYNRLLAKIETVQGSLVNLNIKIDRLMAQQAKPATRSKPRAAKKRA